MGIHEARIEGTMSKMIQKFLKPRSFKVKVNEILSDTKAQTEAKPQGSVVRLTFFTLKMNKIVAKLPSDNWFQISLYVDDLQISYRYPDWKVVQRKLLDGIKIVEKIRPEERLQVLNKENLYVTLYKIVNPALNRTSTRQH